MTFLIFSQLLENIFYPKLKKKYFSENQTKFFFNKQIQKKN
jgi:hypothetical protein